MKNRHKKALALNADFLPFAVINWKKAVKKTFLNQEDPTKGVEVIDFYKNDFIKGAHGRKYPIPAVVRIPIYIKRKKRVPFNRKNVFIRDRLTCQYCGHKFPVDQLTYDHVIPRGLWDKKDGTPTHWENIITACILCNRKKGNRTPEQAKMPLLNYPHIPTPDKHIKNFRPWEHIPQEWKLYLNTVYKGV